MLAAVSAAEHGSNVLILEKMNRAGRKMLISGKGRCNITNTACQSEFFKKVHPRGKFLKQAFATFFSKDIINLLEENGLKTKTERGGRIFPESDKASDVVKTLVHILKTKGIELRTDCKVSRIITENNVIQLNILRCILLKSSQHLDKSIPVRPELFRNFILGSTGKGQKDATCYHHHNDLVQ